MDNLARVEPVKLREVWQHEQTGFSRWLVQNIDFLNEHLPFTVDPESLAAEQAAGDFFVDVVGDAVNAGGESFKVVIENQLEETDHKHLGQVLTYVSAFDASAAIWIAANARPEHAKAIQWLNDESNIDAWLFTIEVISIGGSARAPLLRQIIGPSALSIRAKQERRTTEAHKTQKLAFWEFALPEIKQAVSPNGMLAGRESSTNPYQSQKADGPATAYWQVWVTSHGTWVCLRIHGGSKEESAHYFDQLAEQKDDIEMAFGGPLKWDSLPTATGSVVRWDNPSVGGFQDSPSVWADSVAELSKGLVRFADALEGPVSRLQPYEPGSVGDQ